MALQLHHLIILIRLAWIIIGHILKIQMVGLRLLLYGRVKIIIWGWDLSISYLVSPTTCSSHSYIHWSITTGHLFIHPIHNHSPPLYRYLYLKLSARQ
jgi:hypothetical protein